MGTSRINMYKHSRMILQKNQLYVSQVQAADFIYIYIFAYFRLSPDQPVKGEYAYILMKIFIYKITYPLF